MSRYLVTNYEQSNFSIYQSRFEDNAKEDIVAISSASAMPHKHISRIMQIGIAIGVTTFVLLCLLAAFITLKKGRKAHDRNRNGGRLFEKERSVQSESSEFPQEIDMKSLIEIYEELPDSGKAELLDQTMLSGSGQEISELSQPSVSIIHELMAHRSSDQSSTIQVYKPGGTRVSIGSTDSANRSTTNTGVWTDTVCGGTTISSQRSKTIDLNRSLPPTPMYENFQVTPIEEGFPDLLIAGKDIGLQLEEGSVMTPTGRWSERMPNLSAEPQTSHRIYSSKEWESSNSPTKPLHIHQCYTRRSRTFF